MSLTRIVTAPALLLAAPCAASILYVQAGAAPGGTGMSWASPYNDLQAALAAAVPGDEVRIAQGVYKPGPPGSPRSVTFSIPSLVAVRGSYAGFGAPDPDARSFTGTPTILSGDLAGNDGPNFA